MSGEHVQVEIPANVMLAAYAHIGMVERVLLTMLETPGVLPPPEQVVDQMLFIAFEGLRAR